jgi:hypothetical protein
MTEIDEEVLRTRLRRAGRHLLVRNGGTRAVEPTLLALADAGGGTGEEERSASRPRRPISRRSLAIGAIVLAVVGLSVGGYLWGGSQTPTPKSPAVAASHQGAKAAIGSYPNSQALPPSASGGAASSVSGSGTTALSPLSSPPGIPAPTPTTIPALPPGAVGQPAQVVETGSALVTVAKGQIQNTLNHLSNLATGDGGFVEDTQSDLGGPDPSGSVTLRVPNASFSTFVAALSSLGTVSSLSTKGTDVTGQSVDLQARITALDQSRTQYLTIMTKATSVGDILSVQSQLDQIQSQIEQLQGQLNVLTNQTTYATLAVTVQQRAAHHVPPPPAHPESGIAKAFSDAVHGFVDGFEGLVRIAGPTLFVLLCLGALVLVGRLAWRGSRRLSTR